MKPPPLPGAKPAATTTPPPLPAGYVGANIAPPPLPAARKKDAEPAASAVDATPAPAATSAWAELPPPLPETMPEPAAAVAPPAPADEPSATAVVHPSAPPRALWLVGGIASLALVGMLAAYLYNQRETSKPSPRVDAASVVPPAATPAPVPIPEPAAVPAARPPGPPPTPPQAAASPPSAPRASAPSPAPQARRNAPANLERLEGAFFLFGQSIEDAGNGYRTAYTVLNSDIAASEPLAGQVKSQVFRVVMNCRNSTWAYDQRFYYAMRFGEGERLAERKWQTDEMKWKPLRDSLQDKKLYDFLCR